jgi:hypothetical protein
MMPLPLRLRLRFMLLWSIYTGLISCKSLIAIDFDAILNDMIGKTLDQNAPKLLRLMNSHREGNVWVNEYWRFNTPECRWLLLVNAETGVVTGLRYPDKQAASKCNDFPASMP